MDAKEYSKEVNKLLAKEPIETQRLFNFIVKTNQQDLTLEEKLERISKFLNELLKEKESLA